MSNNAPTRAHALTGLDQSNRRPNRGKWLTDALNPFATGERQNAAMSIAALHSKARCAVEAGEHQFKKAAECLAAARKLGATQRQSAKAIGKSPSWVNQLLAWRKSGYKGGAFERSNKSRAFSRTKQARRPMTAEEALAQKAQAEFQTARAVAVATMFGADTKRIPAAARKELLKALAMLGSEHAAERASAALIVERQRARLNLRWDDLIVPAEVEHALSEAA